MTVTLIGKPVFYPGYMFGLDQPSLTIKVQFGEDLDVFLTRRQQSLLRVDEIMRSLAPPAEQVSLFGLREQRIDYLIFWISCLLVHHRQPSFSQPRVISTNAADRQVWLVTIPCLEAAPAMAALHIALYAISLAHEPDQPPEGWRSELAGLIDGKAPKLQRLALNGFNMSHFLKEAHHLGVPWFRFSRDIFQLGYGAKSRLLNSSISDGTPSISVAVAKSKQQTSEILRQAGLPVPEQLTVRSANDAVVAAGKIGFPVVVKPSDLDGGIGVGAFLQDEASVRAAYDHAVEKSKNIVVEKHVDGNDYRILIVNGQVLGVLERVPGGVVGDGSASVRELVERQNQERASATDDRRFLHPINPDAEAERMLLQTGLTWADVPAAGRWVRLRAAANVASGGVPKELPVADIHPDNIALAQRASRVLRLDIAGMDLLIPDIRRSWMEIGAGICEMNAQPQMFTTLHAPLLRAILPLAQGRIPIIVILTSSSECGFSKTLYERVLQVHPHAGWVTSRAAWLGGQVSMPACSRIFETSRALLVDTSMDALLISACEDDILVSGWPVDRCDVLLFAGSAAGQTIDSQDLLRKIAQAAKSLRPKSVLIDSEDAMARTAGMQFDESQGRGAMPASRARLSSKQEMIDQVMGILNSAA